MDLKINVCVWNAVENKYYLLSPSNPEVQNPMHTTLVHLNSYSLIYLDSKLMSEHSIVNKHSTFNIETTLIFMPGETVHLAKIVDVVVCAESTNGFVVEIGQTELVLITFNSPAEISIPCMFPDSSPSGKYKVYLKAINDLVEPDDIPTDFISSYDNSDYFCYIELNN